MNFNYQKARDLMVENQLRPNKIKDPLILNLFRKKTNILLVKGSPTQKKKKAI